MSVKDKIINDPKEILQEEKEFYKKLYTAELQEINRDTPSIQTFINNANVPKLSDAEQLECEGELTEQELLNALKHTSNNKSPGSDGFPAEFYKVFWEKCKKYLLNSLNAAYNRGLLSITQRHGIISLLPKKDKNSLQLKNWRPISLLNQDYKLVAKSIAFRLKKTLSKIINEDQTGFMENRYIGENINKIINLMDFVDENDIPAILILVDFEKAFDRLEWKFIQESLQFFNFGPSIQQWIKVLYTDINSCVINNGWTSETFSPSRGVRQGCPLSPYLFILCAEILAIAIREDINITGIKVDDVEYKISQYADDTSFTILANDLSLNKIFDILKQYQKMSGMKTNLDKTEVLRIGAIKNSNIVLAENLELKWTNIPATLLGVKITPERDKLEKLNYLPKLKKIEQIFSSWDKRNLSVIGKTLIIKSLALSQLLYLTSVIPNPEAPIMKRIETLLFKYVWNKKPDKIKRNYLISPTEKGGLGIPHVPSQFAALKCAWIKRLISESNASWKLLILRQLPCRDRFLWGCNFHKRDIKKIFHRVKSKFWLEVISSWSEFNYKIPETKSEIENETLWFNSLIRIGNETVLYKKWYDKGIKHISDILSQNGTFLSFDRFVQKFQLSTNFLMYRSLISAIPLRWKEILALNENMLEESWEEKEKKIDKLLNIGKVPRFVYPYLPAIT